MGKHLKTITDSANRRGFIGGSDARIIMGTDEAALVRLWQEKRGERAMINLPWLFGF
jgi:predicted phage-related endonuclease